MKLIARLAILAVFFLPAVAAWFVCPMLMGHGSSSAFDMAVGLALVSVSSALYGVINFATTAA